MPMTKRKDIDWKAIEADYRADIQSIRQIATKHGVSDAAIRKKAGQAGWSRTKCAPSAHQSAHPPKVKVAPPSPHRPRPRPKAQGGASPSDSQAPSAEPDDPDPAGPVCEVLPPLQRALPPPGGAAAFDPETVGVEPTGLIDHVLVLARRQLEELDATTSQIDQIEEDIDGETAGDRDGRRRAAMLKAVSLPARTMTLKTIAQVLELAGVAGGKQKLGKKEQRQGAAVEAGRGRFAPRPPPKLVVDNG